MLTLHYFSEDKNKVGRPKHSVSDDFGIGNKSSEASRETKIYLAKIKLSTLLIIKVEKNKF